MWLFTQTGFVSIVKHRDNLKYVLVRARLRIDLENFLGFPTSSVPIKSTSDADYPYRAKVTKKVAARLVRQAVKDIDYDNFKNAAHGDVDRDSAYMKVWSAMLGLQRDKEPLIYTEDYDTSVFAPPGPGKSYVSPSNFVKDYWPRTPIDPGYLDSMSSLASGWGEEDEPEEDEHPEYFAEIMFKAWLCDNHGSSEYEAELLELGDSFEVPIERTRYTSWYYYACELMKAKSNE